MKNPNKMLKWCVSIINFKVVTVSTYRRLPWTKFHNDIMTKLINDCQQ